MLATLNHGIGWMHARSFREDPKHLAFVLARYGFVAKMLRGRNNVLEIGCGDGTGAQIVRAAVTNLYGIDIYEEAHDSSWYQRWNVLRHPYLPPAKMPGGWWDGVYCLDVLEHIDPDEQDTFFRNINVSLAAHGVVIVGTPSLESQKYASEESVKHHVNCHTEDSLRAVLGRHYSTVLQFGMNDSTLHTGFGGMCHYRLAICTNPKGPDHAP